MSFLIDRNYPPQQVSTRSVTRLSYDPTLLPTYYGVIVGIEFFEKEEDIEIEETWYRRELIKVGFES